MSQIEKRCMGCMNPLPDGRRQCGICGYPADGQNEAGYLKAHTLLSERYLVGRLLQYTGDAAVYLGYDVVLKNTIRIREFFPNTLSERDANGSLRIIGGCEHAYGDLLEKFRVHARALARLRELSNIEAVYDIFDAGNTAYTVAEYCEGNSLETRLGQTGGRMRWEEARPLFMPLLAAVASLHAAGVYHLGISPQNLIVGTDGKLHLQSFCMADARQVGGDLTPDLLPGYSAPEQYSFGEETGAYTDVYGLAATIFRTLTGNPMPEGSRRAKDSNDLFVPSDVAAALPNYVAAALFQALQVNPAQRIQTVQAFKDKLSTAPAVSALREEEKPPAEPELPVEEEEEEPPKKRSRGKMILLVVLISFAVLVVFFGALLLLLFPNLLGGGKSGESSDPLSSQSAGTTIETALPAGSTTKPVDLFDVPSLVGKNVEEVKGTQFGQKFTVGKVTGEYSDKAEGTILSYEPKKAAREAKINVVISMGPEKKIVPDYLVGLPVDVVERILKDMGFQVDRMGEASDTIEKDHVTVVEHAGTQQARGTSIQLRYSTTGPTVPPTDPPYVDPYDDWQ